MPSYPTRRHLPPCPDPDCYIAIQTKEGWHWRLRRGFKTPVSLNHSLKASSHQLATCSPAARRLRMALAPYLFGLKLGRVHNRFTSALRAACKAPSFSYAPFLEQELQPEYPLRLLLSAPIRLLPSATTLSLQVPVSPDFVHRHETLVSDCYLQAVLVNGNPFESAPLSVQSAESPLYAFDALPSATCTLHLPLDTGPWLLLLKFCSLEGNDLALHARHYGMRVVGTGGQ